MLRSPSNAAHRNFPLDTIHPAAKAFEFARANNPDLPPLSNWIVPEDDGAKLNLNQTYDAFFDDSKTDALLIIRNDTILYERYFGDDNTADEARLVYSCTKSFNSALIGFAIQEGYIPGLYQPVCLYIPEWSLDERRHITLGDALYMSSGLAHEDKKKPWNMLDAATLFWQKDSYRLVRKVKPRFPAGTAWAYKSLDSHLAGLVLVEAVDTSWAAYAQAKLWEPLGMEFPAYMSTDLKGSHAKAFGGLAVTARDMARFGRLFLNNGNWNGVQLLDEDWVKASRTPDTTRGHSWQYVRGWWVMDDAGDPDRQVLQANGLAGQFIILNPVTNTIIVRQGPGMKKDFNWSYSLTQLSWALGDTTHQVARLKPLTPSLIDPITGTYESEDGRRFCIEYDDGALIATGRVDDRQPHKSTRLYPDIPGRFLSIWGKVRITQLKSGEACDALLYECKGRKCVLKRVE
ncbi:MAG: serine hydrolase domain-containing protein [Bacteroidota bacterium]